MIKSNKQDHYSGRQRTSLYPDSRRMRSSHVLSKPLQRARHSERGPDRIRIVQNNGQGFKERGMKYIGSVTMYSYPKLLES